MAPEVDSDDENVEYEDDSGHQYRLYLDELDTSSTAPRSNSSASLQGKFCLFNRSSNRNQDTAAFHPMKVMHVARSL